MDSANAKTLYFALACFRLLTNLLCCHMKVSFFASFSGFSVLFPVSENWTAW